MLSVLRFQEQERFPSWDCLLVLVPLQLKKIFGIKFKMSAPWRPIWADNQRLLESLSLFFFLNFKFIYFHFVFLFLLFILLWLFFLTLQYCIGFATHQHESTTGNCFTILFWFLPYINMNQTKVYVYPSLIIFFFWSDCLFLESTQMIFQYQVTWIRSTHLLIEVHFLASPPMYRIKMS